MQWRLENSRYLLVETKQLHGGSLDFPKRVRAKSRWGLGFLNEEWCAWLQTVFKALPYQPLPISFRLSTQGQRSAASTSFTYNEMYQGLTEKDESLQQSEWNPSRTWQTGGSNLGRIGKRYGNFFFKVWVHDGIPFFYINILKFGGWGGWNVPPAK